MNYSLHVHHDLLIFTQSHFKICYPTFQLNGLFLRNRSLFVWLICETCWKFIFLLFKNSRVQCRSRPGISLISVAIGHQDRMCYGNIIHEDELLSNSARKWFDNRVLPSMHICLRSVIPPEYLSCCACEIPLAFTFLQSCLCNPSIIMTHSWTAPASNHRMSSQDVHSPSLIVLLHDIKLRGFV